MRAENPEKNILPVEIVGYQRNDFPAAFFIKPVLKSFEHGLHFEFAYVIHFPKNL